MVEMEAAEILSELKDDDSIKLPDQSFKHPDKSLSASPYLDE